MTTETTQGNTANLRPWQPGQSGNPAGRPKGSRHKLSEAFVEALHVDFMQHGVEAIATVRDEKPDQYLKVIASLLPKDINLNFSEAEDLTDEQLVERIRNLQAAIAPFLADGTRSTEGPTRGTRRKDEPPPLH